MLGQYWTVEYQKSWSGTGTEVACRVSVGLVLAVVDCVVSIWLILGRIALKGISRTSTGSKVDCDVSTGLVLDQ